MASLLRQAKLGLRRGSGALIKRAVSRTDSRMNRAYGRALCYLDMMFVDYGIARVFYNNQHHISPDIWRSAQPIPRHVRSLANQGVKTIINLRNEQTVGTRWLEQNACERFGVKLVDVRVRSRAAPTVKEFKQMRYALESVEYPILIHCKSGADRAGVMSVLARHIHDGVPIKDARDQLSLKFGHIRQADTGILDAVFDRYVEDNEKNPIEFWQWVETVYDHKVISQSFKANSWATRFVGSILRRE
jgi:protein tyrosine/serine phosphatase